MTNTACSDAYKDFKDAVVRRLGNPVFITFLFSWCFVNWRLVAMLCFSKLAMAQRIEVIEEQYLNWGNNLGWPLFFTCLYLAGMPWVLAGYSWISGFATNKRHRIECNQETTRIVQEENLAQKQFNLTKIRTGNKSLEEMQQQLDVAIANVDDRNRYAEDLEQIYANLTQDHEELQNTHNNMFLLKEKFQEEATVLKKFKGTLEDREIEWIKEVKFFKEGYKDLLNDYEFIANDNKALTKEKQQLKNELSIERNNSTSYEKIEESSSTRSKTSNPISFQDVANFTAEIGGLMQDSAVLNATSTIGEVMKNSPVMSTTSVIDSATKGLPKLGTTSAVGGLMNNPASKWIPKK